MNFTFEPLRFIENLSYMGLGMLGIFVAIGLIVVCTLGLNKIKDKDDK